MGTNTGSRLPNSKPATGPNLPSLKITSLAGMASATRTSLSVLGAAARVGQARGHLQGLQERSGPLRWAGSPPGPRRNRRRSSVKDCSTRAVSAKADDHGHVAGVASGRSARPRCRLASSSREGFTSVACMLAELSIKRMKRLPESCMARQCGRTRASTASSTISNCSSKQQVPPQPLPDAR